MIDVIYVEREAREHPRAQKILERFSKATVIECERYGEVFNRASQNFRLQKQSPALVLAKKFDNFVLPTPDGYGVGGHHNYYFSHMLNCLYDCRYCFLQGMYRSANYLLFVNYEDFQDEMRATLNKYPEDEPVYFFSGYDCDSMALENVSDFAADFMPFMREHPSAYLELRTKSANIKPLLAMEPTPNCIVAFSMTPDAVAKTLEHGAASVSSRIKSMKKLADAGWKIGLRFDPLIYHEEYQSAYRELFNDVFEQVPSEAVHSVSFGPLRFPPAMFEKIRKLYPQERLFAGPLTKDRQMVSYPKAIEDEMASFCRQELERFVPETKFFACTPGGPG